MAQLVTPTSKTIGIWICLAAATLSAPSQTFGQDAKKPVKKDTRVWYRLVNVTIPAGCALRNLKSIDHPPQIYVVVRKNGVKISATQAMNGWTVAFPATKVKNQFPIRLNSTARYTLEVWDYERGWWDNHIFNITGLKGEEFQDVIYLEGGEFEPKNTWPSLKWEKISTPKKYKENK
jgi:hypothetical protein